MQAYTEIVPPTAVTHAITTPFINSTNPNLIVAKTSLLQIFEVKHIPQSRQNNGIQDHSERDANLPTPISNDSTSRERKRFVLVGEYHLAGTITSIASAKLSHSKSGGHTLLIAHESAKFSLVQWDPLTHGLATISVHYYEREDDLAATWLPELSSFPNQLTVDPQDRCAAFLYGQRSLAVLPFRQSDEVIVGDIAEEDAVKSKKSNKAADSQSEKKFTVHGSSFTLNSTLLDDALSEPIDITFAFEYREPTLGILAASFSSADKSLSKARDSITYQAFTLDLEQRARTPLFAVRGLPSDIFKLQPLPLPVGGSLLVGGNELVHIDQSGKSQAIAVNKNASRYSSYPMTDETHLDLTLDGCIIQRIAPQSANMLIVLETGNMAVLHFRMEGRAMAGMTIHRIPVERGGETVGGAGSCAALIGPNTVFIGCGQADSVLLDCGSAIPPLTRKRSHADMQDDDGDDFMEDDLDEIDELYGDAEDKPTRQSSAINSESSINEIIFTAHDCLPNYAALGEPIFAKRRRLGENAVAVHEDSSAASLELVLPTGCGRSGSLTFLRRSLTPIVEKSITISPRARRTWAVATRSGSPSEARAAQSAENEQNSIVSLADKFVITCHVSEDGDMSSSVRSITITGLEDLVDSDFEADTETIAAGTLACGSRIVQVSPTELRSYDQNFSLSQILPIVDEETDEELSVLHASFCDPFLLLIRSDGSAFMFRADENGELEEVERAGATLGNEWVSGCLHDWSIPDSAATLYLLSKRGALHIFATTDMTKPIYVAEDLCNLPPILTEAHSRRAANPAVLVEVLVADLGPIRTEDNDIEIYEPYCTTRALSDQFATQGLRWLKKSAPHSGTVNRTDSRYDVEKLPSSLVPIKNLDGYNTVFVAAPSLTMIFKEARSNAIILQIQPDMLVSLCGLHTPQHPHGLIGINTEGDLIMGSLPRKTQYGDICGAVHRLPLGQQIQSVAYHSPSNRYIVATSESADKMLQDGEANGELEDGEDTPLSVEHTNEYVKLIDPQTWSITDEYKLPLDDEQITCMCVCSLQLSETTDRRRTVIAVGTSQAIGEDGRALGSIYVFDIIPVAPDARRKGSGLKLKMMVQEEVRGGVTALSEVSEHGLLLVAMGQKCQVRGLTEVGTLLPVSFMDVQEDVTTLKMLRGTDMFLIADIGKGLWFGGFQTEPYKMSLFGKTRTELSVVAAEFLPFGKQLLFVVADANNHIHIFEYRPENPGSLSGQRLLHKSAINTGHPIASMTLLPCTLPSDFSNLPTTNNSSSETNDETNGDTNGETNGDTTMTNDSTPPPSNTPTHQVLITHTTGAHSLLHPLTEPTYRRLTTLQSYLISALEQPCALNPRSYRAVDTAGLAYAGAVQEGMGPSGARTIVDGGLVGRWRELGVKGMGEAWGRVGGYLGGEGEVERGVREVELLKGAGLSYL